MPKIVAFTRMRERKRLPPWKQPRTGAHRRWPRKRWLVLGAFGFVVVAMVAVEFGFRAVGCDVKANISASGARIYHIPGQEHYHATRINWLAGERWFCSESAARAAGWRRARV